MRSTIDDNNAAGKRPVNTVNAHNFNPNIVPLKASCGVIIMVKRRITNTARSTLFNFFIFSLHAATDF